MLIEMQLQEIHWRMKMIQIQLSSLPLHGVGGVQDDQAPLESSESSRPPYDIFSLEDILPIETARARFLQFIADHFLQEHVIEVPDCSNVDYTTQSGQDNINKRKSRGTQYEGDPRFVLPLMYVANLYETLVNDVNLRLASVNGVREKTMGVALEAAGGLYRRLAKKFPKKGPYTFRRRELATSVETRSRFPELVIQEEKRVRFVVVNGLEIVEKPNNILPEDADWFRRMTGRHEVAISARDYKFYSPRHKYRRLSQHSVSNIPGLSAFPSAEGSLALVTVTGARNPVNEPQSQQQSPVKHLPILSPQSQLHQPMHQSQHTSHLSHLGHTHQCCTNSSHSSETSHAHHSPTTMPQHMCCIQPHSGSRLNVLPTSPAKFCDECGAMYLRETSKFCSECGVKRLGT
ncbi:uncharacterized protein At2g02148 isoform X2 [Amborella trichopoda]|uniref:uncharacterized protein At2g02148 isoform X2 n=1 Tax=Amborella trichopoda TaxID=13333 RepID=UPI0009BEED3C|nr:uncharacterized protein At2g02148 isoform X2 [Amborella trichopoda]|eukprot:XP_020525338.1 uncharacterized protein At2g02148 isoform X2 [Amborella trichopoda]